MPGRPLNEDRAIARQFGYLTYQGAPHPKCGTTERYTRSCGCVHCARLIATEQREARRLATSWINHVEQEVLDEQDAIIQDEMVAEARDEAADLFHQSIEELM